MQTYDEKPNQSRGREPLIAHSEQTLNAGLHILYLLVSTPFLKEERGKWVFDSMCFIRVYIYTHTQQ